MERNLIKLLSNKTKETASGIAILFLRPGQAKEMVSPERNYELEQSQVFVEITFFSRNNLKFKTKNQIFYLNYSFCLPLDCTAYCDSTPLAPNKSRPADY
jgi:hypothetical protein